MKVNDMLNELDGKGLIIHHWDTDGICSAALLLEYLKDKVIETRTPILGNYYLTEEELKRYSKYDFIIIADMSFPEDNILFLAKNAKIMIFDHHLGKLIDQVFHNNPVIKGEDPDLYPSTSWIVNEYFKNKINLYAILGIVGDHENEIKNNNVFFKLITSFCDQNNLFFKDLLKMVYLIDSNYKLGNKKAVEDMPFQLLKHKTASYILDNEVLNKNQAKLNDEINRILAIPGEESANIIIKNIETPYNIISTITRKVAWSSGKNTLVINTGFFEDKDQIYLRSKKNVETMIKRGREFGFRCGGKQEVLGAILPKNKTDFFVNEILEFLKT